MKFKVDRAEIQSALEKARNTMSVKDAKPVLRNFCLKLVGADLAIMATDMELASVCEVKVEPADSVDGVTTIPGEKFYETVIRSKAQHLVVEIVEGVAHITLDKFKSKLQVLPADDFPTITSFDSETAKKAPRDVFLDQLNRISFSISDNESRKNLMAVKISAGFIQASDGMVTSVCEFKSELDGTLIPSLAIPELVRVLRASKSQEVEIASTENFLLFRLDKDLFVSRLSQAQFPDVVGRVLKPTEKNEKKFTVIKSELLPALRRVSVTANMNNFCVAIKIADGKLFMSATDADGNFSNEDILCTAVQHKVEGAPALTEPFEMMVNYNYIQDICKSLAKDEVVFTATDNIRVPLRFEEDSFISLLMRLSPAQLVESTDDRRKIINEKFEAKKSTKVTTEEATSQL